MSTMTAPVHESNRITIIDTIRGVALHEIFIEEYSLIHKQPDH